MTALLARIAFPLLLAQPAAGFVRSATVLAQIPGRAGDDLRRVTVTARWQVDSTLRSPDGSGQWHETLDINAVLEMPALVLPGGPFTSRPGPRTIGLLPDGGVIPAGARVVSATVGGRHAGRFAASDKGTCDSTAAYLPGDETSQGTAPSVLGALVLAFSRDSLVGLMAASKPFSLETRRETACGAQQAREQRTVTAAFGALLEGPGAAEDPGWSTDVRRTATGYSGSARLERREALDPAGEARVTRQLTFTVEIQGGAAAAAPSGPPGGGGGTGRGEVTFMHGGRQVRWALAQADVRPAGGMLFASLVYTPEGRAAPDATGAFALTFMQQGGTVRIVALTVRRGPAGDAEYDVSSGGCVLRLAEAGTGTLRGDIECRGGFRGTPVTTGAFTATR